MPRWRIFNCGISVGWFLLYYRLDIEENRSVFLFIFFCFFRRDMVKDFLCDKWLIYILVGCVCVCVCGIRLFVVIVFGFFGLYRFSCLRAIPLSPNYFWLYIITPARRTDTLTHSYPRNNCLFLSINQLKSGEKDQKWRQSINHLLPMPSTKQKESERGRER